MISILGVGKCKVSIVVLYRVPDPMGGSFLRGGGVLT